MAEEVTTLKISIRNVPKNALDGSIENTRKLGTFLMGKEARIAEEIVLDYNEMRLKDFLEIFSTAMAVVFTRQTMAAYKQHEEENNKNTEP